MPTQKNKVVGRYGRPKKKKRLRVKFRFSRKIFYLILLAAVAGVFLYFFFIADRFRANEANVSIIGAVNEEREAIGIWCKRNDCFYFDKKGIIFEEAPKSSGSLLILIEDARDTAASIGSAVLNESQIALAEDSQRLLKGNFPFAVSSIVIRAGDAYELLTTEGWRVLLNNSDSLEYQLSNLKYLLDKEIKERRRELDYVDLRLGNRLYYKYTAD
jgi:hypothetical protein